MTGVAASLALIEFPADDAERALAFWSALLERALEQRSVGSGWQSQGSQPAVGVHARGRGPGDSFSLPYFEVDDLAGAAARVGELGGTIVHPGEAWVICRDTEGNPFALAARSSAEPATPRP